MGVILLAVTTSVNRGTERERRICGLGKDTLRRGQVAVKKKAAGRRGGRVGGGGGGGGEASSLRHSASSRAFASMSLPASIVSMAEGRRKEPVSGP